MDLELPSRPKRTRASYPKVRSGCSICKSRRIKCDEAKPACDRCVKSQRTCEYPNVKPIIRRCKIQVRQPPKQSSVVHRLPVHILPRSLSIPLPGTNKDKVFFHRYQAKVSYDMGGTFGLRFFTDVVLQDCHASPTIYHLAVAVAAIATSVTHKRGDVVRREHCQFALQHVNTALRSLRQMLHEGTGNIRLAVSACGLLCAFETIQGNYENSRNQLVSGRKVFDNWRLSAGTGPGSHVISSTTEFEYWEMFRRLELNFSMYAVINPTHEVVFAGDKDVIMFEDLHFTTAAQGRILSYSLLYTLSRFLRNAGQSKRLHWPQKLPRLLQEEGEVFLQKMDTYMDCFRLAMRGHENTPFYLIYSAGFDTCHIAINAVFATEEIVHDQYLTKYREIVKESKLLQEVKQSGGSTTSSSLFDVELYEPLFFVGSRCRDPALRREVLTVLRDHPKSQSLWDTSVLIAIIEWIMSIEEIDINLNGCIVEDKRIQMHTMQWDVNNNQIHIEAMQGGPEMEPILHRATIQLM